MIEAAELERLRSALGTAGVSELPQVIEGCKLGVSLRPETPDALSKALGLLKREGRSVLVRGGGSRLSAGNLPGRVDALLELDALAGVDELDAEEGVMRACAGTRLESLRGHAQGSGWEVPLDAPEAGATLGGTLASAAQGPRFGHPRDVVLGLDVCLASGERIRCGGRVVKNVTGYDLAKLFTGSHGTLGVIESAWLRLRALPERVELRVARLAPGAAGAEGALASGRLPSARAVSVVDPGLLGEPEDGPPALVVELGGDDPAVARDLAWLDDRLGAAPADFALADRVRAAQASTDGLRFRISSRASRLSEAAAALRAAGAASLAHPARGLLYALFPDAGPDPIRTEEIFRAARAVAHDAGGHAVLEHAPVHAREGRDVFDVPVGQLPLHRELKRQYDPGGVLNPGRFAGRL